MTATFFFISSAESAHGRMACHDGPLAQPSAT